VNELHAAIEGVSHGEIINLTDRRAANSRDAQLDLLTSLGPDGITKEAGTLLGPPKKVSTQPVFPHLVMPTHHDVRPGDVVMRRLHGSLAAAANCGPRDFAELLLVPGVGARTVHALALVAEVVHGAPCRFSDPARFSLAHGARIVIPFRCRYASMTKRFDSRLGNVPRRQDDISRLRRGVAQDGRLSSRRANSLGVEAG